MKILAIDIETSPNTAYVWSLWKENIPLARLIDSSDVICWSAKWVGHDDVMFDSVYQSSQKEMLAKIHSLLDVADVVIHYNGMEFDIPCLNKEFVLHGFTPPSPYRQVDLLKTVRSQFKFTSNKLDYVCERLGLGKKIETTFQLWVDCMNLKKEAWKLMEEYNKHDVNLLEHLYFKLLPWIKNHPNRGLYNDAVCCPNCGGTHLVKRGHTYTAAQKYQRYRCADCGTWSRGVKPIGHKKQITVA